MASKIWSNSIFTYSTMPNVLDSFLEFLNRISRQVRGILAYHTSSIIRAIQAQWTHLEVYFKPVTRNFTVLASLKLIRTFEPTSVWKFQQNSKSSRLFALAKITSTPTSIPYTQTIYKIINIYIKPIEKNKNILKIFKEKNDNNNPQKLGNSINDSNFYYCS